VNTPLVPGTFYEKRIFMAAPVWILSVDLQAKTAAFQTGMSDAARSARGSFDEIGGSAERGGRRMGGSMMEARHSVMMLGEEFGVRIPRALASFIAGLGPVGAALEAAFPFLAVIVGATLLIEHLKKMREAGIQLTEDQVKFGTAINNAFGALDQKLIQAQIKSDELRNDHLGALRHQLELLDKTSMADLVHSFEEVAKSADVVLKGLEGHWYKMGAGSDNAEAALKRFKGEYEGLLSLGTKAGEEEAHGLLSGTLAQAQKVLALQRDAVSGNSGSFQNQSSKGYSDQGNTLRDIAELKKFNIGYTENEVNAQTRLVQALEAQVKNESELAAIKKTETDNSKKSASNDESARRAAGAKASAESMLRLGEQSIATDKVTADALLDIHRASLEQRLTSDLDFVGRDRDVKLSANAAEIAALDKSGKDYQNQLKSLNDKNIEIGGEYNAKVAELKAKSSVDINSRDLRDLEQNNREKIEATRQGSDARLAAIDAAIREEESLNLQDTNYFRDLLNTRVQATRQSAEEEGRHREEAGIQAAESDLRIGELRIAMERAHQQTLDSTRIQSWEKQVAEAIAFADEEYRIRAEALAKEVSALDTTGRDYENRLKDLQNKEKQITEQHEAELTAIKEKAEQERNQHILAARVQLDDSIARGLTQSLMGHQTWARMVTSLGDQVASAMLETAIKSALMEDFSKEKEAGHAARLAFLSGMKLPFPLNVIAAPVMAAGAFAAMMAFEGGTDRVPGVGRGDVVPSMLTPGEGVVPGGVMDGLRNMARNGGFESERAPITVHVRPTYHVNTIDGDGMQAALTKHTDQLQRHFENTLRRMNH
jgi:hypothetical protein